MKNRRIKKIVTFSISLLLGSAVTAQVGINTKTPKVSLEIASTSPSNTADGIIVPRLKVEELAAKDKAYGNPQNGALVFVTSGIGKTNTKTSNVNGAGFYYYDAPSSKWVPMVSASPDFNNLYTSHGTLTSNRIVTQGDKSLEFAINANKGNKHFTVDGSTLSVDAMQHKVGVGTTVPTQKLDVDGEVRIRNVQESDNAGDAQLVIDEKGVVKRSIVTNVSNTVKAYLTQDYVSPNANNVIHRISPFSPVGEVPTNFDSRTGAFTVQKTGVYKATITVTVNTAVAHINDNYVVGIYSVQGGRNKWISKTSLPRNTFDVGYTYNSICFVELRRGDVIYFGTAGGARIFANPRGQTGRGIGSFFQIEFLSEE